MSALFFSFSLVIGLIIVLSDWRIRESIVNDQILKLVFSLISLLLCIPLLVILREFVYSILNKLGIPPINISLFELMISFFLGLIAFYFISKITIPKTDKP